MYFILQIYFYTESGTPYEVVVVAFTSAGKGMEAYSHVFFSNEETPKHSPKNVKIERSGTSASVSWDPLNLFEARGFPVYTITLEPSTTDSRVTRQSNDGVIRVTTNETSVVIGGLDPKVIYNVYVAVKTSAGDIPPPEPSSYCASHNTVHIIILVGSHSPVLSFHFNSSCHVSQLPKH